MIAKSGRLPTVDDDRVRGHVVVAAIGLFDSHHDRSGGAVGADDRVAELVGASEARAVELPESVVVQYRLVRSTKLRIALAVYTAVAVFVKGRLTRQVQDGIA